MNVLPPMPPYEGLHPIVVHFPIALTLCAPVLVVLGLVWRRQAGAMFVAAAVVLAMAAAGAVAAAATGEAAGEAAERLPGVKAVLEEHEELGELARNLIAGLAVLGAALAGGFWLVRDRARWGLVAAAGVVFLALHGGVCLVVINAAHQGGRLVHELGVRAPTGGSPAAATQHGTTRGERD